MHDYSIRVPGLPPAKYEAKSTLAFGHGHSERALAPLKALQSAVEGRTIPFTEELLAMELVVTSPTAPPSDATNYLGGAADFPRTRCTVTIYGTSGRWLTSRCAAAAVSFMR